MRTTALCLTLLLAAACEKSGRRNSVWLVVKNESGQSLQDFSLEHGKDALRYQIFDTGLTHGGWARVPKNQALVMSFTDGVGARMTPPLDKALTPDMVGGVFTITLGPEGRVEQNFEPMTAAPAGIRRSEGYVPWIGGLLALVAVLPVVLLIRRAGRAAARVPSAVKRLFSNPVLEEAVARLGLTHKVCPVRMFTLDPAHPTWWWEGTADGRMVGLLDSGRIWIGGPDEATLCVFERTAPDAPFVGRDFTEREDNPLLRDAATTGLLRELSAAVSSVQILGDAVQAEVAWRRAEAEGIVADARVLSALKSRVEELDPPLVRAVMRGDEHEALALIRSGASLEDVTIGYLNAMTAAASAGRTELVKVLLAAGARAQPEYGFPLHAAASAGHAETVNALLDAGVAVDALDAPHDTALIMAAIKGREEVVALLLSRGADPNAGNLDRGSALGYAKYEGFTRIVEMLRAAGAKEK